MHVVTPSHAHTRVASHEYDHPCTQVRRDGRGSDGEKANDDGHGGDGRGRHVARRVIDESASMGMRMMVDSSRARNVVADVGAGVNKDNPCVGVVAVAV